MTQRFRRFFWAFCLFVALLGFVGFSSSAQTFSSPQPAEGSTISDPQPKVSVRILADTGFTISNVQMVVSGCTGNYTQLSPGVSFLSDGEFSVDLKTAGCTLPSGRINVIVVAIQQSLLGPGMKSGTFSWSFSLGSTPQCAQPPCSPQPGPSPGPATSDLKFSDFQPASGATISELTPTISVKVTTSAQGASVLASSLEMLISVCTGMVFKVGAGATFASDVLALDLRLTSCSLRPGSVAITVNAEDSAGRARSASWSFKVQSSSDSGPTPNGAKIGDVNLNGTIDEGDVSLLKNSLKNGQSLSENQRNVADVTRPCGKLSSRDLKRLERALKRLQAGKKGLSAPCFSGKRVGDIIEDNPGTEEAQTNSPKSTSQKVSSRDFLDFRLSDFRLLGVLLSWSEPVQEAHLQIFDLRGKRVYAGDLGSGHELFWDPSIAIAEGNIRPLANGIYLYIVTGRSLDGRPIRSAIQKLLVLR